MKNNYFYLRKEHNKEGRESISKYEYSFNDTIEEYLEELAFKYPMNDTVDLCLHGEGYLGNIDSEESLKQCLQDAFGARQIWQYLNKDFIELEEYDSDCKFVKISRAPVIHDIIARFVEYQNDTPLDTEDDFADVRRYNLVEELIAWYEHSDIKVIKFYSWCDKDNSFEYRCEDHIDNHISECEKHKIIQDLFSHITLTRVENVKVVELYNVLNLVSSLNTTHSSVVVSEIKEIIRSSKENNELLPKIGFDPEYADYREKSIIVVSNIHGLLANKNLFTGKITHVTKCFNNNNDASKEHVYYEESEFVYIADEYVEATAEDIYTYRENYYLLDGTRPFLDMTVEEIESYLEKNK